LLGLALEVCEPRQQAIDVAGLRLYCDIRSPLPGVNDVTNQLERLNSKETKLPACGSSSVQGKDDRATSVVFRKWF
jgi:hypothetical protein